MIALTFAVAFSFCIELGYQRMTYMFKMEEIPIEFAPTTKFISVVGDIESNNNISLTIDISCNLTWINKNNLKGFEHLEATERRSYTQKGTKDIEVKGYYLNGYFSLSPILTLNDYSYLIADEIKVPTKFKSMIGLARRFNDENENFIIKLYKESKILSPVFSLVYYSHHLVLQIGNIVEGIHEYPEFAFYISILDIDEKWRISLRGVFFGDLGQDFIPNVDPSKNRYRISQTLYQIDSNIEISSTDKNIIVPLKFLEYVEKYYFKGKYCHIVTSKLISVFQCDPQYQKELYAMEDIHFVVDKNLALSFAASELYTTSKTGIIFFALMSFNEQDRWVFGYYFMKKFHLTFFYLSNQLILFSLESKSYVILDNTPRFEKMPYLNVTNMRICLMMQIVVLSIGLSVLLIQFKRKQSLN